MKTSIEQCFAARTVCSMLSIIVRHCYSAIRGSNALQYFKSSACNCVLLTVCFCLSLFMEILEKSTQNNDIVFFEDGSWDAIGAIG